MQSLLPMIAAPWITGREKLLITDNAWACVWSVAAEGQDEAAVLRSEYSRGTRHESRATLRKSHSSGERRGSLRGPANDS